MLAPARTSTDQLKILAIDKSAIIDNIALMCARDIGSFAIVEGESFLSLANDLIYFEAKYGNSCKINNVAWKKKNQPLM